jgi:hypothetical protein
MGCRLIAYHGLNRSQQVEPCRKLAESVKMVLDDEGAGEIQRLSLDAVKQ